MTRRTRGDEAELSAHRRERDRATVEVDVSGDLFSREQAAGVRDTAIDKSARKAQIQRDIERLRPHVLAQAKSAGWPFDDGRHGGITVADVRKMAEDRSILTGEELGRALSWLGPAMKGAFGLLATSYVRRSRHRVDRSHGNRHTVYVHPDYASKV